MATILRHRSLRMLALATMAALLLPAAVAQAAAPAAGSAASKHSAQGNSQHKSTPKPPKHRHPHPPKHTHPPRHHHPPKHPHPHPPKPGPIGDSPAPSDISASMPRTMRDDLTGDFLGRGYDQRMRAEGSNLNIYNPPSRGGALAQSEPLDLGIAPDDVYYTAPGSSTTVTLHPWSSDGHCSGCFQSFWGYYHLSSIYLARNNQNLFITGTQGHWIDEQSPGTPDPYRNYLYQVPADGSCASSSCATSVTRLPDVYAPGNFFPDARQITVTSLSAGNVNGRPYLAVGLSDYGVQIYDVSGSKPRLTSTFTGMKTSDNTQTPATAVAWDPAGSGLLAVGVISWADRGYFVSVDASGVVQHWQAWQAGASQGQMEPVVMSAAIGRGLNGEPVAALGMDWDNRLQIFDNPTGTAAEVTPTSSSTGGPGTIVGISPIPRVDGITGGDDFAVSYQSGGDIFHGSGALWRWDGTSSPLIPQSIGPGPNTVLPDWDTFRKWYPGIKEGRFRITNNSSEPVTINLHARPQAGYGCWYAPAWSDAAAFPSQPLTVAAGQTSSIYVMGAYTAGAQGACGAGDPSGTWRGYLTITPANHTADTKIVDLQLDPGMSANLTDQAASSTTVQLTHEHPPNSPRELGGAFGLWTIAVNTAGAPVPQAAPTVTPYRLTTTQPGRADVYRFDVAPTTWSVPGAGATAQPRIEAIIPPLTVQGSVDGSTWSPIGTFLPPGTLQSGVGTVTVGGGSFFWENAPNAPAYQQIRVLAGALASAPVALNQDPPAAPSAPIRQVTLSKGTTNTATPAPNGLDQAALAVQISTASGVLPSTDPAYGSVYYRNENNDLITNLYQPGAYSSFLGVQPSPGAYPNTTLSALPAGSPAGYVSTTSTSLHTVQAYVGTSNVRGSQPLNVVAAALNIQAASSQNGAFSLVGCSDFTNSTTCAIGSLPALYQAGSTSTGPLIGALLIGRGQNAVSDLPLQWSAKLGAQNLATTGLTVVGTNVTLSNQTQFLPDDNVDLTLVSHGQQVAATVPVGSG